MRGQHRRHLSPAEPVLADILIVDHQIVEKAVAFGQRGQTPGRKAVGIDRDAQGQRRLRQLRQVLMKRLFQQGNLVKMPDQAQPRRGGGAGLAAPDQPGAHPFLKRLQPLRDGRGRDMQLRRRKIKGAAPVDGGKGGKMGGVEHGETSAVLPRTLRGFLPREN